MSLLMLAGWCALGQSVVTAQVPSSETTTLTATIQAIDKATRTVTLKTESATVDVKAPDQMEGFNSLKVGDRVTATYFQAIALSVRKPGEPAASGTPITTQSRKDRMPGSETRRQQTFTVTVESVDVKAPSVTVKTTQGRVVSLAVQDVKQIQNLKAGDSVDVTYYESLMIKVARAPK